MDKATYDRLQVLSVIQQANPAAYALARQYAVGNSGLSGLGETVPPEAKDPGIFDTVIGALKEIAPVYTQYQLGRDLYKLNMTRAQQGLEPVDAAKLSPQMQVGITGDTRNMVLILGALAIAALFFGLRKR